ncbi:hypothetical protein VB711_17370, partial [Cronbergia sp. UHCC 0137]|uniref:hypothetical protein n=1 Tax=Cronbergia sp. UHCC 0137 TaxID=3110239 RepID=UPI002B2122EA
MKSKLYYKNFRLLGVMGAVGAVTFVAPMNIVKANPVVPQYLAFVQPKNSPVFSFQPNTKEIKWFTDINSSEGFKIAANKTIKLPNF